MRLLGGSQTQASVTFGPALSPLCCDCGETQWSRARRSRLQRALGACTALGGGRRRGPAGKASPGPSLWGFRGSPPRVGERLGLCVRVAVHGTSEPPRVAGWHSRAAGRRGRQLGPARPARCPRAESGGAWAHPPLRTVHSGTSVPIQLLDKGLLWDGPALRRVNRTPGAGGVRLGTGGSLKHLQGPRVLRLSCGSGPTLAGSGFLGGDISRRPPRGQACRRGDQGRAGSQPSARDPLWKAELGVTQPAPGRGWRGAQVAGVRRGGGDSASQVHRPLPPAPPASGVSRARPRNPTRLAIQRPRPGPL